ncbi:MAG: 16S rRNA (cytidine(1402)-2'-O)-methyltransferase [Selenomonadaceae bacterium]|nr:16S rRNA (cytidine(1402)-2'-O)-methyltransferase [Selenomonadaceae bacterium]
MLYLCATPIGNLEDITLRALRILKESDLILAEDTRVTRKILARYEIHVPLETYNENNHSEKISEILDRLSRDESIVCVSDAGTPAISDPGFELVKATLDHGFKISPLPGASAGISALICSGLDSRRFTFIGFLPRTKKKRADLLSEIHSRQETLIFYEAPHRLKETLEDLFFHFGNRRIVLARELTKIHEEFLRGRISELLEQIEDPRGEFVIIVEGFDPSIEVIEKLVLDPLNQYKNFLKSGLDKKSAIRETAKICNMSRREIYQMIVKEDNQ